MLKKISKNTVASQVINQITDLIRSGKLQPGDRLPSERDMAEQLGVSRPPLREALRVLEYVGVTETHYGEGIYVKSAEFPLESSPLFSRIIDTYTLEDMIEMRKIVETAAVRLAVERAGDDDIDQLQAIHERSLASLDDVDAFVETDFSFHRAIAETTGNTMLFNTVDTMRKLISEFNRELLQSREYRKTVCRHHEAILNRIGDRNAQKASQAMERHLDNVVKMSKRLDAAESAGEARSGIRLDAVDKR